MFSIERWKRQHASLAEPSSRAPSRDTPTIAIKPMSGGIRVVCVDQQARSLGIVPGVSLNDARALVPNLIAMDLDEAGDWQALEKLAAWCQRYTPWSGVDESFPRPPDGTGDLWLDISGCGHLFGGEPALMEDLLMRFEQNGLTAHAAVADTPGSAWALARFGPVEATCGTKNNGGLIVPSQHLRALLEILPMAALRLPGSTLEALSKVGLRRVGELTCMARAPLVKRFGMTLATRLDQALGHMSEPLSPQDSPVDFSSRIAFAEGIARREDIDRALQHLLEDLCQRMEVAGQGARTLVLSCERMDSTSQIIEVGTSRPARRPPHLARLFHEKLDHLDPGFGIEVMILTAPLVAPMKAEQSSMDGDACEEREGVVSELVDRLGNKLGGGQVVTLKPQASHIPEKASTEKAAGETAGKDSLDWPAVKKTTPRPLRLLNRPAAIEALAMVPDGPPIRFTWKGRQHRVMKVEGPERIAPEWWQLDVTDRSANASQATRDYFRVELEDGQRLWLFREGLYEARRTPRWFIQGVFA
jgi:protein ImuB